MSEAKLLKGLRLPAALLFALLLSPVLPVTQKINVFIGNNPADDQGFKIPVYPDIVANRTIISSRDFNCTEERACFLQPESKTAIIDGKNVTYRDAVVQINLIKEPFEESVAVMYLEEDKYNFGSALALRNGGPFLNYLYQQNQKQGYNVKFSLDAANRFEFQQDPPHEALVEGNYFFNARAFIKNQTAAVDQLALKFCVTNKLDRNTGEVFFGVPQAQLPAWQNLVTNNLAYNNTDVRSFVRFALYTNSSKPVGNFDLKFKELIQNGAVKISGFDAAFDHGRRCDIYTGTLFLKKFDFAYFYTEYSASYVVQYRLRNYAVIDPDNPNAWVPDSDSNTPKSSGFWLKIIIFVAVLGGIGYFLYNYVVSNNRHRDDYRNANEKDKNIELRNDLNTWNEKVN